MHEVVSIPLYQLAELIECDRVKVWSEEKGDSCTVYFTARRSADVCAVYKFLDSHNGGNGVHTGYDIEGHICSITFNFEDNRNNCLCLMVSYLCAQFGEVR